MKRRSGFSLIEVLVSVVILGLAVAGLVDVLGRMAYSESRALDKERIQQMAEDKLDELVAIGTYDTPSGDFSDRGLTGYSWQMTYETTSITDVNILTVTVTSDKDDRLRQSLSTAVYQSTSVQGGGQ